MDPSPLDRLLEALDALDVDAAMAMVAPDGRILTADGRRAEGADGVRDLVSDFLSTLRATTHRVSAEWHLDDVWIAEVDATYELRDGLQTGALPRAFILRDGPDGLSDVRVYGAHELPLSEFAIAQGPIRIGGRWVPAL
jgi:SnoaL-like domain